MNLESNPFGFYILVRDAPDPIYAVFPQRVAANHAESEDLRRLAIR